MAMCRLLESAVPRDVTIGTKPQFELVGALDTFAYWVNRGFVPQGQEQSIKAIKTRQRFLVATPLKLAWKFFPQAGKKQSWVGCIGDAVGFVKHFVCAAKGALGDEYEVTKCASTFIHAYIPNLHYS